MQKIISVILALVLGLLTFAGCAADETISDAETTDDTALETSSEEILEDAEEDEAEEDEESSKKKKTSKVSSKKKNSSKKNSSKKTSSNKTSSKKTSSKKSQSSKKQNSSSNDEEPEEVYYTQEEKIYYGLDPEMYEIGLKNAGNSARIAALMKKAQKGGSYKIAVLGGSISEGAKASSSSLSYGNLICEWWCANFPDATFGFVNAGFGSTNPEMACYRMEEDLLKHNPDFVVVDFTVNTYLDNDLYNTYSTILYKILSQKNTPAVMSIDFTNCNKDKYDLMTYEKTKSVPVGSITNAVEAYDIPAMSYHNYIWKKIKDGIIRWPDIGGDYIHPNNNGHMTAASLITCHLKEVLNNLDKYSGPITAPAKPDVSEYLNLGYIINTANGITMSGGFKNRSTDRPSGKGWEYKASSDASKLTIPVPENKNIKVFMKFDEGSEGEITVTDSNNKPRTITSKEAGTPTLVEIGKMSGKITFAPDMAKGGFQIYGIGVKK